MSHANMKPARAAAENSVTLLDLDAVLARPLTLKFKGVVHSLKHVTMQERLEFDQAWIQAFAVMRDQQSTADEVVQAYHDVISSVCETLSLEDVKGMTKDQAEQLLKFIVDVIRLGAGEVEKKNTKPQGMSPS